MTKGTKKVLIEKTNLNLTKFWELNKIKKTQKLENAIRTQEQMQRFARLALENFEIDKENKFKRFILQYAFGETVLNKFGKKIFFKLANEDSKEVEESLQSIDKQNAIVVEVVENQLNLK